MPGVAIEYLSNRFQLRVIYSAASASVYVQVNKAGQQVSSVSVNFEVCPAGRTRTASHSENQAMCG